MTQASLSVGGLSSGAPGVLQEPMSLLKGTLQQLAEHKTAPERYLIVLAMEAGEEGHAAKAGKLIEEFGSRSARGG